MSPGLIIGICIVLGIWLTFAALVLLMLYIRRKKPDEQLHLHLTTPSAVRFVADDKGVLVDVNEKVYDLLGYKPADLIGKPLGILVPERFKPDHREAFKARVNDSKCKEGATIIRESLAIHALGYLLPVKIAVREYMHEGQKRFLADISAADIFPQ